MALSRVVQDLKVVKGFHSVVESVLKDGSIVLLTKQTVTTCAGWRNLTWRRNKGMHVL